MEWLSELGFAGLFMLCVAGFFALALFAGLLTAISKASGAFKRGWSAPTEKGD